MIICKTRDPLDDYLQEARSSGRSFASDQIIQIISCKSPVPLDDYLLGPGRGDLGDRVDR